MLRTIPELHPFLSRLQSHSALSDAAKTTLRALPGRVVQVRTHHDFIRLGEFTNESCFVVEGVIGRFSQTDGGGRQIVALDFPGDLPDLNSVAVPRSGVAMQALSTATLVRVPHGALREAAEGSYQIARAFWRESVLDGAKLAHWLTNVGRREAVASMANLFCEIACRTIGATPQGKLEIRLPITQAYLSDILGLSQVHVNRVVRQLRERGLAMFNRPVLRIPDFEALADFADFDADYLCLDGDCTSAVATS